MPTNVQQKAEGMGVAGAIAVIIVWVTGEFGLDVPPEVAAGLTTVLATIAAYIVRTGRLSRVE